jgi:hypothetical protein
VPCILYGFEIIPCNISVICDSPSISLSQFENNNNIFNHLLDTFLINFEVTTVTPTPNINEVAIAIGACVLIGVSGYLIRKNRNIQINTALVPYMINSTEYCHAIVDVRQFAG